MRKPREFLGKEETEVLMFDKGKEKIGFIGFGEVGCALSHRMKEQGGQILAYDKFPDRATRRAEEFKVPLALTMEDLVGSCSLILATVWPDAALDVAKEAAPLLGSGKIYCDMNSISPETTAEIQQAISTSGADFVKIAIMAGIPDRGFEVPLLAGGVKAEEVTTILSDLGLFIRPIGSDPRKPAAIKILRSVCLKGIVALAYEMVRGAEKYGVVDQVLDSASEVMSRESFKKIMGDWLASTAIHARRRAKEMEEAIETLEEAGINPIMSIGTKEVFEEIAGFGLDEVFQGQIPDSFHRIFEAIAKRASSDRID